MERICLFCCELHRATPQPESAITLVLKSFLVAVNKNENQNSPDSGPTPSRLHPGKGWSQGAQ